MMIGRVGGGFCALGLLVTGSHALAETRLTTEVSSKGTYSSNPFGGSTGGATQGQSRGSGSVSATVTPNLSVTSPTVTLGLNGRYTRTEFFQNYDATDDFSVNGSVSKRLSPSASLSGNVAFTSMVRSAYNPVRDPSVPVENPDDPIIVDPAAGAGFAQRTNTLNGAISFSTRLGAYDTLQVSGRGALVEFKNARSTDRASNYKTYGGAVAYQRTIGPNSTIGISGDAARTLYDRAGLQNSTQFTPSALFGTQLAERVSLNLSAGVTIAQFEGLTAGSNSTSFSGSANLCHIGDRARFCLQASHRVSPTTLSGASTVSQIATNVSYTVGPRSSVSASASYAKSRAILNLPGQSLGGINNDYGFVSANYSYRIRENLSAIVTVLYSGNFGDPTIGNTAGRNSNVSGSIGISYRLGEL